MRRLRWATVALTMVAGLLLAGSVPSTAAERAGTDQPASAGPSSSPAPALTARVLSSRPDTVSGGEALVEVGVPDGVTPDSIRIRVGHRDMTGAFRPALGGAALRGLVDGLAEGHNPLVADTRGQRVRRATLRLTNHPRTGPVFSGPHETPFVCDTEEFELVAGGTLGKPLDENCSVETRVDYAYRTTEGGDLKPLPEGDSRPDDLAWTTTNEGTKVPYVVRIETGTVNRAIYEIAMLAEPGADPDPWTRSPGWNGKLMYTFGGGCAGGWYVQGRGTGNVTEDGMLRQGYAVASSSLNVFGNNCNDLLAAETMSMVKERFAEAYGAPEFTVGWGCSGGSYQVHQIGDNYPGLLDGIIAACSFPDVGFGTVSTITDAGLLDHYFKQAAPRELTKAQQRAISGFGKWESIANLAGGGQRIDPRVFCPDQLPEKQRYDPENNPDGARCDVFSHTKNAYGVDRRTGLPLRPLDNVGIQYGLDALNEGTIDVDEFLDLNEDIGGFDTDANFVAERTVADRSATRSAYETGRMLNGGGGLAGMPIIDYREYTDDLENGDIHLRFHSFSTRDRLEKANGTSANQVMLVEESGNGGFNSSNPILTEALAQMDKWLTSMRDDDRGGTPLRRVIRNKPAALTDACWTRGADREKVEERQVGGVNTTRCNTEYPVWPSPRMVAGAGVAADVVKCRLRRPDADDYAMAFDAAQERRLRHVFRRGVCDWNRPGTGQRGLAGTWMFFGNRPGSYRPHER